MSVSLKQHPAYAASLQSWQKCNDAFLGETAVKARQTLYLPYPYEGLDLTDADQRERYQSYLQSAHFVNFVERSVRDLKSGIFREKPELVDIDLELYELCELETRVREVAQNVILYGRALILADYPLVDLSTFTIEAKGRENIKPVVTVYSPLSVPYWRTDDSGRLVEVIMREPYQYTTEGLVTVEDQYRQIVIEDSLVISRVYRFDKLEQESVMVANGQNLTEIPAYFVGIDHNTDAVDEPPMLSLINTNLRHYQVSAEIGHAMKFVANPQLVVTGFDDDAGDDPKIRYGTDKALMLGTGQDAKIIEGDANKMALFKELERLEVLIDQIGSWMTQAGGGAESAEALRIRFSGGSSRLADIAASCSMAITKVYDQCAAYEGINVSESSEIILNDKFYDEIPDAQLGQLMIASVNASLIPPEAYVAYLQRTGLVVDAEDPETILNEAQLNPPMPQAPSTQQQQADSDDTL